MPTAWTWSGADFFDILVLRGNDCLCAKSRMREKVAVTASCVAQRLVGPATLKMRSKPRRTSTMRCQPDLRPLTFKGHCFRVNEGSLPGADRDFGHPLLSGTRAKDHLQLPSPVLAQGDQLPLDLRRQVPAVPADWWDECVAPGAASNRRGGSGETSASGKYLGSKADRALPLPPACDLHSKLAPGSSSRALHRRCSLVGPELHHCQLSAAIGGQQVQHAAVAARQRRHLRVDGLAANCGKQLTHLSA
jgi:hypothetical protein